MSALNNRYEIENIIRKSGTDLFGSTFKMPRYFDDSAINIGHTFKYHRSSPFNAIWVDVLPKLHSLGLSEWQMSCPWDYTDRELPVPAKWLGIRNARLPRK